MNRVLRLALFVCGEDTCQRVFEPLVADWQRELEGASGLTRWWMVVNGSSAVLLTLTVCLLTGGSAMPRAVMLRGIAALVVSTLLLMAIQIGLNATTLTNDFPLEMRFWIALPMVLPLAIPLALLPILMLIRGARRITTAGAATVVGAGAILAYLTAGWLAPLAQADVRDELYQEIYQREAARDARGDVTYPGTAVRQLHASTPERRAAALDQWRQSPAYLEAQAERTRPRWGRSAIIPALLALAMGTFGWALGELGRTRVVHAIAWWSLTWIALMFLDGRFLFPGNPISQIIGRPPYWLPLAVFATAALAASIAAGRRTIARVSTR